MRVAALEREKNFFSQWVMILKLVFMTGKVARISEQGKVKAKVLQTFCRLVRKLHFEIIFISFFFSYQELCYGEQMFGTDMCVSGEYTRPLMSRAPIFPFFGPAKFNVSIKPGKSAAQSIQFKVRYTLALR